MNNFPHKISYNNFLSPSASPSASSSPSSSSSSSTFFQHLQSIYNSSLPLDLETIFEEDEEDQSKNPIISNSSGETSSSDNEQLEINDDINDENYHILNFSESDDEKEIELDNDNIKEEKSLYNFNQLNSIQNDIFNQLSDELKPYLLSLYNYSSKVYINIKNELISNLNDNNLLEYLYKKSLSLSSSSTPSTTSSTISTDSIPSGINSPKSFPISMQSNPINITAFQTSHPLRDYQILSLSWLNSLYLRGMSGIFADEMGLGKTYVILSYLLFLSLTYNDYGPHLIICPLSVLNNWENESKKFINYSTLFNFYIHYGQKNERLQNYDNFFTSSNNNKNKIKIILVSYDMFIRDYNIFKKYSKLPKDYRDYIHESINNNKNNKNNIPNSNFHYSYYYNKIRKSDIIPTTFYHHIIVDECHRLKNSKSILHKLIKDFLYNNKEYKLISNNYINPFKNYAYNDANKIESFSFPINLFMLSATPMMNNLNELISLFTLINPFFYENLFNYTSTLFEPSINYLKNNLLEDQNQLSSTVSSKNNDQLNIFQLHSNILSILHQIFKPVLLRRLKKQVLEVILPDIIEKKVFCPFTHLQEILYRFLCNVYEFNEGTNGMLSAPSTPSNNGNSMNNNFSYPSYLLDESNSSTVLIKAKFQNLMMQLRKLSNHPYLLLKKILNLEDETNNYSLLNELYNSDNLSSTSSISKSSLIFSPIQSDVPNLTFSTSLYYSWIIQSSGKLIVLIPLVLYLIKKNLNEYRENFPQYVIYDDSVLEKIIDTFSNENDDNKKLPHRILIFCQMTKIIDILEQAFTLLNIPLLRLDGSLTKQERDDVIYSFRNTKIDENNPSSQYYYNIFLISTRAGGQGLNLQEADTVIFFDSDFNPQWERQAISRSHRMGQKKTVLSITLASIFSLEEESNTSCSSTSDSSIISTPSKSSSSNLLDLFKENNSNVFQSPSNSYITSSVDQKVINVSYNKLLSCDIVLPEDLFTMSLELEDSFKNDSKEENEDLNEKNDNIENDFNFYKKLFFNINTINKICQRKKINNKKYFYEKILINLAHPISNNEQEEIWNKWLTFFIHPDLFEKAKKHQDELLFDKLNKKMKSLINNCKIKEENSIIEEDPNNLDSISSTETSSTISNSIEENQVNNNKRKNNNERKMKKKSKKNDNPSPQSNLNEEDICKICKQYWVLDEVYQIYKNLILDQKKIGRRKKLAKKDLLNLMIICDKCDDSFHIICVGLHDIPKGEWICQPCLF